MKCRVLFSTPTGDCWSVSRPASNAGSSTRIGSPAIDANFTGNYPITIWLAKMVVTPDGRYLVTTSFFGVFDLWDLERREKLWEQKGTTHTIRGLMVSRDSESVFCYAGEKELIEYDLLSGAGKSIYHDSEMGAGTGAGFSRNGDLIYTGSSDGLIRIWSVMGNLMIGKIDTAML